MTLSLLPPHSPRPTLPPRLSPPPTDGFVNSQLTHSHNGAGASALRDEHQAALRSVSRQVTTLLRSSADSGLSLCLWRALVALLSHFVERASPLLSRGRIEAAHAANYQMLAARHAVELAEAEQREAQLRSELSDLRSERAESLTAVAGPRADAELTRAANAQCVRASSALVAERRRTASLLQTLESVRGELRHAKALVARHAPHARASSATTAGSAAATGAGAGAGTGGTGPGPGTSPEGIDDTEDDDPALSGALGDDDYAESDAISHESASLCQSSVGGGGGAVGGAVGGRGQPGAARRPESAPPHRAAPQVPATGSASEERGASDAVRIAELERGVVQLQRMHTSETTRRKQLERMHAGEVTRRQQLERLRAEVACRFSYPVIAQIEAELGLPMESIPSSAFTVRAPRSSEFDGAGLVGQGIAAGLAAAGAR